ncbi:hypothetical protein FRC07_010885 [Ceratobasidium sp. 392]|nr:hypothetical protein FRC07_010885 [Ceratobasidium sp. 392]
MNANNARVPAQPVAGAATASVRRLPQIHTVFNVVDKPPGMPGSGFSMRETLQLEGVEYLGYLPQNTVRDVANALHFDWLASWRSRNSMVISKIYGKMIEIYPNLAAFDRPGIKNPLWPVECALQVAKKSGGDRRRNVAKAREVATTVSFSPSAVARRRALRQASARKAAKTREEKRKARIAAAEDRANHVQPADNTPAPTNAQTPTNVQASSNSQAPAPSKADIEDFTEDINNLTISAKSDSGDEEMDDAGNDAGPINRLLAPAFISATTTPATRASSTAPVASASPAAEAPATPDHLARAMASKNFVSGRVSSLVLTSTPNTVSSPTPKRRGPRARQPNASTNAPALGPTSAPLSSDAAPAAAAAAPPAPASGRGRGRPRKVAVTPQDPTANPPVAPAKGAGTARSRLSAAVMALGTPNSEPTVADPGTTSDTGSLSDTPKRTTRNGGKGGKGKGGGTKTAKSTVVPEHEPVAPKDQPALAATSAPKAGRRKANHLAQVPATDAQRE